MIRLATSSLFEQGINQITSQSALLGQTQNQLSTGRRVLTPADDPLAAARSLDLSQAKSINDQYSRNIDAATGGLSASETALATVTTILQNVKTLAVNAGDAALSPNELASLANEVQANYQELLGQANATDGNGQYLFSGYQGSTPAFSQTGQGTVAYNGDQGARLAQISAGRQIPVSLSGSDVFQLDRNGNGTFVTAAAGANTGTGIVSPGAVTNAAAWNGVGNPKDFSVKFFVDNTQNPPVTTYDLIDNVNNVSLETGAASAAGPYLRTFTPGASISLATQAPPDTNPAAFDFGASLDVTGAPATGDTFSVKGSSNVDLFSTLSALVSALKSATPGAAPQAGLTNSLNTALSNLDLGLTNVLRVRAAVGSSLKELDDAKTTQGDLSVQYQTSISKLTDLDYAKAISDFTFQQQTLTAAQQSFAKISDLTLFKYL